MPCTDHMWGLNTGKSNLYPSSGHLTATLKLRPPCISQDVTRSRVADAIWTCVDLKLASDRS